LVLICGFHNYNNKKKQICQWLATSRWFSPVSFTNKTDRHHITEILLKVTLNHNCSPNANQQILNIWFKLSTFLSYKVNILFLFYLFLFFILSFLADHDTLKYYQHLPFCFSGNRRKKHVTLDTAIHNIHTVDKYIFISILISSLHTFFFHMKYFSTNIVLRWQIWTERIDKFSILINIENLME
jgi:hypothetical protein